LCHNSLVQHSSSLISRLLWRCTRYSFAPKGQSDNLIEEQPGNYCGLIGISSPLLAQTRPPFWTQRGCSMSALNRTTCRRLKNLQQIPSVWEGDRRPLLAFSDNSEPDAESGSECILWVDGSEGIVRAMDVVSAEMGPEAVVRALLRAMEHPQSPARPARPSKIVVRDREIQFYLRGVLQELDIAIDYFPDLPLIDELFRGFEEVALQRQPTLPPQYADLLRGKAYELWHDAPWELLADHNILSIELNQWDVGTLYASVMGMLGMEYGTSISLIGFPQTVSRFGFGGGVV